MEKITLTPEMLQNASDYIPLMKKQELVEAIAQKCLATVKMSARVNEGGEPFVVPDRFQERREMIAMYQMGVFATHYLHQPYAGDDSLQMPADVYDNWAGSHVFNQMERLKGDKDIKDKVFNILYDFKEFQWMLRREIEVLIGHNNDVVARLAILVAESMGSGMMAAAQAIASNQENEPTVEETAQKVAEAKQKLEALETAQRELAKSKAALDEASKLALQKRAVVDEFTAKLTAKKGTEAGYNVRADK